MILQRWKGIVEGRNGCSGDWSGAGGERKPFTELGGACWGSIMLQIHYFNSYLLSTHYAPVQTLGSKGAGNSAVNKTDKSPFVIALTLVDGQQIGEIDGVLGDGYSYDGK